LIDKILRRKPKTDGSKPAVNSEKKIDSVLGGSAAVMKNSDVLGSTSRPMGLETFAELNPINLNRN
jgi:hypothetical protein